MDRLAATDKPVPSVEMDALMGRYLDLIPPDFAKVQDMFSSRADRDPLPQTAAMRVITKWLEAKARTLDSTVRGAPLHCEPLLVSGRGAPDAEWTGRRAGSPAPRGPTDDLRRRRSSASGVAGSRCWRTACASW